MNASHRLALRGGKNTQKKQPTRQDRSEARYPLELSAAIATLSLSSPPPLSALGMVETLESTE